MAPIRRYLRITKYSALECRIYLENPALTQSWLLHPRYNVLGRVIESVRPLVLPKLQEERERTKKRTGASKKKSIKDVIIKDDFEISVYLIETPTRHSLLVKHKKFRDRHQTKLQSNSRKLLGGQDGETPINVEDDRDIVPNLLVEDDNENMVDLNAIPLAPSRKTESPSRGRSTRLHKLVIRDSDEEPADEDDHDNISGEENMEKKKIRTEVVQEEEEEKKKENED